MKKELPPCPVAVTLSIMGNKWVIFILKELMNGDGPKRFGELQNSIGIISQKVLTSNLRKMEEDGLITRQAYVVMPPKVEYSLTEFGWSLKPVIASMIEWGNLFMTQQHGDSAQ